jgi:GNAT superfamily N-acetyltransferase
MPSRADDPFLIRPATPDDAPSAAELLRASITQLCIEDHHHDPATVAHWLQNKTAENVERWRLDPRNCLLVAVADGELCGVALVAGSGDVRLCYVKPGWQCAGVGRALLHALEAQAVAWGLGELRAISTATARGFYERQEFISDGEPVAASGIARGYPYRKRLAV